MNDSIQVLILAGSLVTAVVAILMSNQLVKKYRLPYLSSYFYYLIFLFVFGVYGLIGSSLIRMYLESQDMNPDTVDSICNFITFLGIPFLVLSWYMFLRLSHELVNRQVSRGFSLAFFLVIAFGFLGVGLSMVSKDLFGDKRFDVVRDMMLGGFTLISVIIYAYSIIQLFVSSGRFLDQKDRSNIRLFGLFYIIFTVANLILLNLSDRGILVGLMFILVLFSLHLLPIFFLSMYLDKNFIEPVARQNFEQSLANFIRKFEISKRESEIVELICKGKSNQDISESLFISLQTVKDHIHRIYTKTGVKNRVQLTNLIRSNT